MKKVIIWFLSTLLLLCFLASCSPLQQDTTRMIEVTTVNEPNQAASKSASDDMEENSGIASEIQSTTSIDELLEMSKEYDLTGNYEACLLCIERLLELDPSNQEAYYKKVECKTRLLKAEVDEFNKTIALDIEKVDNSEEYLLWIRKLSDENALMIQLPFIPDSPASNLNTLGNSCGNLNGGGFVALQGKWAYFRNNADGGKLYKLQPMDTSDRQKLCDDKAAYVNVIGDTIYYVHIDEISEAGDSIYSIRTDGANRTKLIEGDRIASLSFDGEWFYFSAWKDNQESIFKMHAGENNPTSIVSAPGVCEVCFYHGYVYYILKEHTDSNKGELWRIPAESGAPERIVDQFCYHYTISEDMIYYISDNLLYQTPIGGGERTKIFSFEGKISAFNVYHDLLFASCRNDSTREEILIVTDLSTGRELKRMDAEFPSRLSCFDGYVFYSDSVDSDKNHRIDIVEWNDAKIDE